MHRWFLSHAFLFGSLALAVLPASAAEPLHEESFRRLHAELQPAADELWRTVPWQIDLLAAQQQAAREHKPIFIWAMDGHPLGCT